MRVKGDYEESGFFPGKKIRLRGITVNVNYKYSIFRRINMIKKVLWSAAAILVLAALVPGLNAQTSLLQQDFNAGGTFPPAGWTTNNEQWRYAQDGAPSTYPYTNNPNYTGGSGYCADCDDDNNNYTGIVYPGSWLQSPNFNASTYPVVWLAYNLSYNDIGSYDFARVEAWDGEGWATVVEYTSDQNPNGPSQRDSFNISQWVSGLSDARVRFLYYETGTTWAWWFEIDNVNLWGTSGGGPGGDTLIDFQLVQIIRPYDQEEAAPFKPTCKVYLDVTVDQPNLMAAETWPADVECRITDLSNMNVVYDKVLHDVPFEMGYTTVGAFPDFTPEGGKQYKALFIVTNPDDIDHDNDNREKKFTTGAAEEVTPTEILAPLENQLNKFSPSAKFLEKAGVDEAAVVLHYRVENAAYLAVSEDSVTHDFTANEEYTATFPEVNVLTDGGYTITFWATSAKGVPISKPEKSLGFNYTGVEEKPEPVKYALSATGNAVSFSLAKSANVSLKVYDAAGNVVAILANGSMDAGSHTATWNARPGVYFVKLATPEYSSVCKAIVVR